MSSRCLNAAAALLLFVIAPDVEARELRVCADPNNLPFSNRQGEGFENRIAELLAHKLKATLVYTWRAQRRGFLRETLNAGRCDLVIGIPAELESVRTTHPYYRSAYVFVTRDKEPRVASFDDPALRRKLLGVQLVGDDGWNTPPAHALTRRGIIENVRGYTLYGDYREPNPTAKIVSAVAHGEIDVALAWGPVGGYFAALEHPALKVSAVKPLDEPGLPMAWDISMAVRKDDRTLLSEMDTLLARLRPEIDAILAEYHVPRLPNAVSPPDTRP
ncbi:substrate-binding domain-containing protein [Sinorhizobium medicae]|uniref:substrate-binding domain-containing protein n=1 Tax=Sinorhizobium medicae TaxID=110321 RepID=UPI000FE0FE6D|nr:substrate-binding domain-containing protein [Sinorhizobium medicae]RVI99514.1 quinoprotein dehydrogenase-associated putative ABC transporter substrate-binding protein [Sinorhizobium medicae]